MMKSTNTVTKETIRTLEAEYVKSLGTAQENAARTALVTARLRYQGVVR